MQYPTEIAGMKVLHVRDLTIGYDTEQADQKPVINVAVSLFSPFFFLQILPVSRSSQMITFLLEGGRPLTLRASGTEPKIKYYFEFITKPGEADAEAVRKALKEVGSIHLTSKCRKHLCRPKSASLLSLFVPSTGVSARVLSR